MESAGAVSWSLAEYLINKIKLQEGQVGELDEICWSIILAQTVTAE